MNVEDVIFGTYKYKIMIRSIKSVKVVKPFLSLKVGQELFYNDVNDNFIYSVKDENSSPNYTSVNETHISMESFLVNENITRYFVTTYEEEGQEIPIEDKEPMEEDCDKCEGDAPDLYPRVLDLENAVMNGKDCDTCESEEPAWNVPNEEKDTINELFNTQDIISKKVDELMIVVADIDATLELMDRRLDSMSAEQELVMKDRDVARINADAAIAIAHINKR